MNKISNNINLEVWDYSLDSVNQNLLNQISSKDIYKNPLESTINHFIWNAIDEHSLLKKEDIPIIISLPTIEDPYLRIIDHGRGFTKEHLLNSISLYFSDKKENNDLIGNTGIGFNSFASYTSKCFVETKIEDNYYKYLIQYENNETTLELLNKEKYTNQFSNYLKDKKSNISCISIRIKYLDLKKVQNRINLIKHFSNYSFELINLNEKELNFLDEKIVKLFTYKNKGFLYPFCPDIKLNPKSLYIEVGYIPLLINKELSSKIVPYDYSFITYLKLENKPLLNASKEDIIINKDITKELSNTFEELKNYCLNINPKTTLEFIFYYDLLCRFNIFRSYDINHLDKIQEKKLNQYGLLKSKNLSLNENIDILIDRNHYCYYYTKNNSNSQQEKVRKFNNLLLKEKGYSSIFSIGLEPGSALNKNSFTITYSRQNKLINFNYLEELFECADSLIEEQDSETLFDNLENDLDKVSFTPEEKELILNGEVLLVPFHFRSNLNLADSSIETDISPSFLNSTASHKIISKFLNTKFVDIYSIELLEYKKFLKEYKLDKLDSNSYKNNKNMDIIKNNYNIQLYTDYINNEVLNVLIFKEVLIKNYPKFLDLLNLDNEKYEFFLYKLNQDESSFLSHCSDIKRLNLLDSQWLVNWRDYFLELYNIFTKFIFNSQMSSKDKLTWFNYSLFKYLEEDITNDLEKSLSFLKDYKDIPELPLYSLELLELINQYLKTPYDLKEIKNFYNQTNQIFKLLK